MATDHQTIVRLDKSDGETSTITRGEAITRLAGSYSNPYAALDAATEASPVQTDFAAYWPAAPATNVEKTAGEQIAHAVRLAAIGAITETDLATAIDDALRSYR